MSATLAAPTRHMTDAQLRQWSLALAGVIFAAWAGGAVAGFVFGAAVVSALGFALVGAGIWKPELGLIGAGLLCCLDPVTRAFVLGTRFPWNTFNFVLLGVMALRARYLLGALGLPQVRILLLLAAVLIAEIPLSTDPENGKLHVLNMVTMLGLLASFLAGATSREALYRLAVLVGLTSSMGPPLFYRQQEALPYINENAWAHFPLAGVLTVAFVSPFVPRTRRSIALLTGLAGLSAVWVFLSGSRGGSIVAIIALVFLLRQLAGPRRWLGLAALIVVGVIAVSSFYMAQGNYTVDRVMKLFDSDRSISNRTSGRSELALGGWYMFLDHPLGVGTGGFAPAWSRLGSRRGLTSFHMDAELNAHSAWVKVLAENGLPGILLLISFVASFFVVGRRSGNRTAAGLGLMPSLAIGIAFLSTEFQTKGIWFLAAGSTYLLALAPRARGKAGRPVSERPGSDAQGDAAA